MKNVERYQTMSPDDYDRRDAMYYLCRVTSDKKILPRIANIKNKDVLDVGIGTGYYSRLLLKKNEVCGVDQNPHLNKLPIKVFKADASSFSQAIAGKKFDVVFSTWTTEYLTEEQLIGFLNDSRRTLKPDGILMTTIIVPYGMGWLYIKMAKYLKGISKYCYTAKKAKKLIEQAGFKELQITPLWALAGLPWAILVTAKNSLDDQK